MVVFVLLVVCFGLEVVFELVLVFEFVVVYFKFEGLVEQIESFFDDWQMFGFVVVVSVGNEFVFVEGFGV